MLSENVGSWIGHKGLFIRTSFLVRSDKSRTNILVLSGNVSDNLWTTFSVWTYFVIFRQGGQFIQSERTTFLVRVGSRSGQMSDNIFCPNRQNFLSEMTTHRQPVWGKTFHFVVFGQVFSDKFRTAFSVRTDNICCPNVLFFLSDRTSFSVRADSFFCPSGRFGFPSERTISSVRDDNIFCPIRQLFLSERTTFSVRTDQSLLPLVKLSKTY